MRTLDAAEMSRSSATADPHARGLALFDMMRALIVSARLVPDPLCYRVLWAYLAEEDAALVRAVDRHLAEGSLDAEALGLLAAEHLGTIAEAELAVMVATAGEEARTVAGRLNDGARELETFDAGLGSEDDAFARGGLSAEEVASSVQRLRRAAARALASHRRIAVALEAGGRRIEALADRLDEAERQACEDHLTGALSRRGLSRRLEQAMADARRTAQPLTGACLDLNRFRRMNEQWGASIGDQMLTFVARFLEGRLGEGALVCRWSGASFMLGFPGLAPAEAERRMERVRVDLGSQVVRRTSDGAELGRIGFTAAVGEVQAFETAASFLERLELSVLAAKREGRDRVAPASLSPPPALALAPC